MIITTEMEGGAVHRKPHQDPRQIVMLNKRKKEVDKHGFMASDMQKDDGIDLKDDKFAEDLDEMDDDVDDYQGDDVVIREEEGVDHTRTKT